MSCSGAENLTQTFIATQGETTLQRRSQSKRRYRRREPSDIDNKGWLLNHYYTRTHTSHKDPHREDSHTTTTLFSNAEKNKLPNLRWKQNTTPRPDTESSWNMRDFSPLHNEASNFEMNKDWRASRDTTIELMHHQYWRPPPDLKWRKSDLTVTTPQNPTPLFHLEHVDSLEH